MRSNGFLFFTAIVLVSFLSGCGGVKVNVTPEALEAKADFLGNYGFFATSKEQKELKTLATIEEVNAFENKFWWGDKLTGAPSRDPNPLTPEHELKDVIDQRIRDIENEIFMTDFDIPGTRFGMGRNGLRSDMANVYLLYGTPHYKEKLPESRYHAELMVWYYLDVTNKHLFRFLFYDNYGTMKLFRNHVPVMSEETLFNPHLSPLTVISGRFGLVTADELYQLWMELEIQDPEWMFRLPLFEFSYYSDVHLEEALDAPEAAEFVAARSKPLVLGQPNADIIKKVFRSNAFHSFIPADIRFTDTDRPSVTLIVGYADIDWEVKEKNAEFVLDLRMSFQNKTNKNIKEFTVRISKSLPQEEVEKKIKGAEVNGVTIPVVMNIPLDDVQNFAPSAKPDSTLKQLVLELEPGEYVVNIDLRHPLTKKYAGGWREEIVIR